MPFSPFASVASFFNKKKEDAATQSAFVPYEEIQEKKTTKLGLVLLIIMVILGVWQGQGFISSLGSTIQDPQRISSCGQYLYNTLPRADPSILWQQSQYGYSYAPYTTPAYQYGYDYSYTKNSLTNCAYSRLEEKYTIPSIITQIRPIFNALQVLQEEVSQLQNSLYAVQSKIGNEKQNYSITLQEKEANEQNTVYDKNNIKTSLSDLEKERLSLQEQIDAKQKEIDDKTTQITNIVVQNRSSIENLYAEYGSAMKLVLFERALLLLLLISPILYLTIRKYFKQKRENSEYSIIWAAIATIFAILFAQVAFGFIYEIIPHQLLQKLLAFFAQFAFLVVIGQYLLLLLTPVIFGGIVYVIQKKIYNKKAVMIRALKSHKCPSCTMSLHESDRYCPVCHYQIKEECLSCKGQRVVGLAYCPTCGVKKEGDIVSA